MPLRVHVHAAIWVEKKLVVHDRLQRGRQHVTLPGGRIKDREAVTEALVREVREEIGCEIEIGDLLFAAEVVNTSSHQDVVLIFAANARSPAELDHLKLVDPTGPDAETVLPPVLLELAKSRDGPLKPVSARWLGNLYAPRFSR
jgi:ADP-ribose pyrophosphatase YjhB (NUDIX family)